jgi:large subunit ribosomal protein L3e
MTHVVKVQERREGKKLVHRDWVHAVSVVETPPIKVIGFVGYVMTPRGLRALSTVWAQHLDEDVKRRFYKNWSQAKKKAFTKYADRYKEGTAKPVAKDIARIVKYCSVVRVIVATQIRKLGLRQHKAHIMEVQLNGGSIQDKVTFAKDHLE